MVQQTMQGLFSQTKQEWLDEARAAARKLLMTRPYVTITDVLEVAPRPDYLHKNITGSVFKHKDFVYYGHQKSTSKAANGRWIFQWKLKEDLPTNKHFYYRRSQEAL